MTTDPKARAREILGNVVYSKCGNTAWEDGRTSPDEVADAILSALDAAGLAVVPKVPTEEMVEAAKREFGFRDVDRPLALVQDESVRKVLAAAIAALPPRPADGA